LIESGGAIFPFLVAIAARKKEKRRRLGKDFGHLRGSHKSHPLSLPEGGNRQLFAECRVAPLTRQKHRHNPAHQDRSARKE